MSTENLQKITKKYADAEKLGKAFSFIERYREIISDPLNYVIERVPNAGYVDTNNNVILHNGIRVPVNGDFAYYEEFSDILLINRGVHEPLEEFCFQQLLKKLKNESSITMIELGAYWGHYSMWMKQSHPSSRVILVEPNDHNIKVGKNNFKTNVLEGEFINKTVSTEDFIIDRSIEYYNIPKITLLHSDIQGYEFEMLQNASNALSSQNIDYMFISTHSKRIHDSCIQEISKYNYVIEIDSEPEFHTTCTDGFILATNREIDKVFDKFYPIGRLEIANSSAHEILKYIIKLEKFVN